MRRTHWRGRARQLFGWLALIVLLLAVTVVVIELAQWEQVTGNRLM